MFWFWLDFEVINCKQHFWVFELAESFGDLPDYTQCRCLFLLLKILDFIENRTYFEDNMSSYTDKIYIAQLRHYDSSANLLLYQVCITLNCCYGVWTGAAGNSAFFSPNLDTHIHLHPTQSHINTHKIKIRNDSAFIFHSLFVKCSIRNF